jgi:anti-sigma factor ChrR (cupin superfamily)
MEEIINLYEDRNWVDAPEYSSGSVKKVLHDENGLKTVLLRLPEGFYMAPHAHISAEQHFVLKGEYLSDGKSYPEGTFRYFAAHENHGPFESKLGALILVIWHPPATDN